MTSGTRLPTWKERENNKKRERRRRAIASKIFAGLRQFGNYKLPKHCDNNEVLKALCSEAGWVVEEDGTTYRKGSKPVERIEVCASAPASPSPTSSYHGVTNGHTVVTPGGTTTTTTATEQATSAGASLIPWLKGLSGTTTPTSCFHAGNNSSSAPVTPPLGSPRGTAVTGNGKPVVTGNVTSSINFSAGLTGAPPPQHHHQHHHLVHGNNNKLSDWDRIAMAEHWLDTTTAGGYGGAANGSGSWSPVIVGPAISPSATRVQQVNQHQVRPCETPDGCLTPCSDVGDSEPSVNELLSRYSGNKSGLWINGTRVVVNPAPGNSTNFGNNNNNNNTNNNNNSSANFNGIFGTTINSSSGTATPTAGAVIGSSQQHVTGHQLDGRWIKQSSGTSTPVFHPQRTRENTELQVQQQEQCSPCSSSVCGVVLENAGKRKRSSLHDFDLEMSSSITRLEAMATGDDGGGGGGPGGRMNDRLKLTLATPASSS